MFDGRAKRVAENEVPPGGREQAGQQQQQEEKEEASVYSQDDDEVASKKILTLHKNTRWVTAFFVTMFNLES